MSQRTVEVFEATEDSARDDAQRPAGRFVRLLWGLVIFLAAALLIVAVTIASIAFLVPDALSGSCIRPQLVRPEECAPNLQE